MDISPLNEYNSPRKSSNILGFQPLNMTLSEAEKEKLFFEMNMKEALLMMKNMVGMIHKAII